MDRKGERIAVFGGSFDPVHSGHAALANLIAQEPDIDRVIMMVSPANPLKTGMRFASDSDRLEMVSRVASTLRNVEVGDLELVLPRPSYSINTLDELRRRNPQNDYLLVIGADNWLLFNKWKDSGRIIREYGLLIYPRPGYDVDPGTLPENVRFLNDYPTFGLSSTMIRERIRKGCDVTYLIPPVAARYISDNRLYSESVEDIKQDD